MFLQTFDRLRSSRKNGNELSPGGTKAGSRWRSEARAEPPGHDPVSDRLPEGGQRRSIAETFVIFFTMPRATALQQGSRLRSALLLSQSLNTHAYAINGAGPPPGGWLDGGSGPVAPLVPRSSTGYRLSPLRG